MKISCAEPRGRQVEVALSLDLPRQSVANWSIRRNGQTRDQVSAFQEFAKRKGDKSP